MGEDRKIKVVCGDYIIWYENGIYQVYDTMFPDCRELCIYEGSDTESLLFALDMLKIEYSKKHDPKANMAHNTIFVYYNWTIYTHGQMFDFDTCKRAVTVVNSEYKTVQEIVERVLKDMAK